MISVIIPAYNCQAFIGETLDSVRAQTETHWEAVVVDDCSTDNTRNVIGDYLQQVADPRIRLVRQEKNAGVSAARNLGVAQAKGEWLAFLDGDDVWLPKHLETCSALCPASRTMLVVEAAEAWNQDLSECLFWHGPSDQDARDLRTSLWTWNFFLPSTMFMHRDLFTLLGGFDTRPEFNHAEDWDFLLRLITTDISIAYSGEVGCKWRKHAAAATQDELAMMQRGVRVLEHHRPAAPPSLWSRNHAYYRGRVGACMLKGRMPGAVRYHLQTLFLHPFNRSTWKGFLHAAATSLRARASCNPTNA